MTVLAWQRWRHLTPLSLPSLVTQVTQAVTALVTVQGAKVPGDAFPACPNSQPASHLLALAVVRMGSWLWTPCQQVPHTGELWEEYGLNPSHLCNPGPDFHLPHLTC